MAKGNNNNEIEKKLWESEKLTKEHFLKGTYRDIDGLCKVATIDQIKGHGYSMNPGRYVCIAEKGEPQNSIFSHFS